MRQLFAKVSILLSWLSLCGASAIDDELVVMPDSSTSTTEIATAIQASITAYPVCRRLRELSLLAQQPIDFDVVSKQYTFSNAAAVFEVLVRLGYLTKTARPDLGSRVAEFRLTKLSQDLDVREEKFCLPAERKLLAVGAIEREVNPLPLGGEGYLIVHFTHTVDPASVWARDSELVRVMGHIRDNQPLNYLGPQEGTAQIYRVWIRNKHPLQGAPQSGELSIARYDGVHNRYINGISLELGF